MFKITWDQISDYSIDGIDWSDAPDFCDAYVDWAIGHDGVELCATELDLLRDEPEFYDKLTDWIH